MTEPTPNDRQRELIEHTDGLYCVDAGPGTGKTFAITRRYARIVDQPTVDPADVLLVTFTRSAAAEMKERIVDHSDYDLRELADAPIHTFHAHCHDLLREHGYTAPAHLGIDERITAATSVVENDLVAARLFREFFGEFRADHPEYADYYRTLEDPGELRDLIGELAAKGIVPTADGWYRDGRDHLEGDLAAFREQFAAVNEPRNDGRKQSELRDALSRYGRSKTYHPDAPSKTELRGERGTKQLDETVATRVFDEDHEALLAFVHDVYHEYLAFALRRDAFTFGFLQLLAFVLLCERPGLRHTAAFEYVMVDEFQDTSELQFKLALLLCGSENLCVVGDWKQSIYSFQYADVENIRSFADRLEQFSADLNRDGNRVALDPTGLSHIALTENYRSTGSILELADDALATPATDGETVDETAREAAVELTPNAPLEDSVLRGVHHEDEHELVCSLVQDVVGNEAFAIADEEGEPRAPELGDIAVFTRTRDYGRELLATADEYGVPMAYDGGIELFRTDAAKLLLAWLRICETDADRGWAVVLEETGYTLDEIDHCLETESYPVDMVEFRDDLQALESIGALVRRVFDRYGFTGTTADAILHTVQSVYESTTLTPGDLIQFIERGIETGQTVDVERGAGDDAVTVQTIHAAKGLEYPIVILANMNDGCFPPASRGSSCIQYREPVGLRQRKHYAEVGDHPHVYDSWRHDVIRRCLPRSYDEERRLLYVAITRAEQHVLLAGGEEPNTFLRELPVELEETEPSVEPMTRATHVQASLPFSVRPPTGPVDLSPHGLMDETIFEAGDEQATTSQDSSGGTAFGAQVHDFAEDYADGLPVEPSNDHERHVAAFLDGLTGECHVEEPVRLPLEVDGQRVSLTGIVDLVHETATTVEIVDYKTDTTKRAQPEYRKQVSVYYHVLEACFPEKDVTASLFYTGEGEHEPVDPLSLSALRDLVREGEAG